MGKVCCYHMRRGKKFEGRERERLKENERGNDGNRRKGMMIDGTDANSKK